jgi:hypothetical protein
VTQQGRRFPLSPPAARWSISAGGRWWYGRGASPWCWGPDFGRWTERGSLVRVHGDGEHGGRGRGRRRHGPMVIDGEGVIDELQTRAVLLKELALPKEIGR